MPKLATVLKMSGAKPPKPRPPLWEGPQSSGHNGGVTQGLIGRFLCCPERFRLHAMEGLRPQQKWNHRTGYGDLWHVCEEAVAGGKDWKAALPAKALLAMQDHPLQKDEIGKWHDVCATQFPIYLDHWRKHQVKERLENIAQELEFCVPYQLPSGRVVHLKGKMDRVDVGKMDGKRGVLLGEHKTKGDVDIDAIRRQLTFDLQTMLYLTALQVMADDMDGPFEQHRGPILGVRYNVVRRPLSGGRYTITQHKEKRTKETRSKKDGRVLKPGSITPAETWPAFCERLGKLIKGDPEWFFARFTVRVSPSDIARFRQMCLDPILERMCLWYDLVTEESDPLAVGYRPTYGMHYVFPFGVLNPLTEGLSTDLEECVATGSTAGLRRTETLFPELGGN